MQMIIGTSVGIFLGSYNIQIKISAVFTIRNYYNWGKNDRFYRKQKKKNQKIPENVEILQFIWLSLVLPNVQPNC